MRTIALSICFFLLVGFIMNVNAQVSQSCEWVLVKKTKNTQIKERTCCNFRIVNGQKTKIGCDKNKFTVVSKNKSGCRLKPVAGGVRNRCCKWVSSCAQEAGKAKKCFTHSERCHFVGKVQNGKAAKNALHKATGKRFIKENCTWRVLSKGPKTTIKQKICCRGNSCHKTNHKVLNKKFLKCVMKNKHGVTRNRCCCWTTSCDYLKNKKIKCFNHSARCSWNKPVFKSKCHYQIVRKAPGKVVKQRFCCFRGKCHKTSYQIISSKKKKCVMKRRNGVLNKRCCSWTTSCNFAQGKKKKCFNHSTKCYWGFQKRKIVPGCKYCVVSKRGNTTTKIKTCCTNKKCTRTKDLIINKSHSRCVSKGKGKRCCDWTTTCKYQGTKKLNCFNHSQKCYNLNKGCQFIVISRRGNKVVKAARGHCKQPFNKVINYTHSKCKKNRCCKWKKSCTFKGSKKLKCFVHSQRCWNKKSNKKCSCTWRRKKFKNIITKQLYCCNAKKCIKRNHSITVTLRYRCATKQHKTRCCSWRVACENKNGKRKCFNHSASCKWKSNCDGCKYRTISVRGNTTTKQKYCCHKGHCMKKPSKIVNQTKYKCVKRAHGASLRNRCCKWKTSCSYEKGIKLKCFNHSQKCFWQGSKIPSKVSLKCSWKTGKSTKYSTTKYKVCCSGNKCSRNGSKIVVSNVTKCSIKNEKQKECCTHKQSCHYIVDARKSVRCRKLSKPKCAMVNISKKDGCYWTTFSKNGATTKKDKVCCQNGICTKSKDEITNVHKEKCVLRQHGKDLGMRCCKWISSNLIQEGAQSKSFTHSESCEWKKAKCSWKTVSNTRTKRVKVRVLCHGKHCLHTKDVVTIHKKSKCVSRKYKNGKKQRCCDWKKSCYTNGKKRKCLVHSAKCSWRGKITTTRIATLCYWKRVSKHQNQETKKRFCCPHKITCKGKSCSKRKIGACASPGQVIKNIIKHRCQIRKHNFAQRNRCCTWVKSCVSLKYNNTRCFTHSGKCHWRGYHTTFKNKVTCQWKRLSTTKKGKECCTKHFKCQKNKCKQYKKPTCRITEVRAKTSKPKVCKFHKIKNGKKLVCCQVFRDCHIKKHCKACKPVCKTRKVCKTKSTITAVTKKTCHLIKKKHYYRNQCCTWIRKCHNGKCSNVNKKCGMTGKHIFISRKKSKCYFKHGKEGNVATRQKVCCHYKTQCSKCVGNKIRCKPTELKCKAMGPKRTIASVIKCKVTSIGNGLKRKECCRYKRVCEGKRCHHKKGVCKFIGDVVTFSKRTKCKKVYIDANGKKHSCNFSDKAADKITVGVRKECCTTIRKCAGVKCEKSVNCKFVGPIVTHKPVTKCKIVKIRHNAQRKNCCLFKKVCRGARCKLTKKRCYFTGPITTFKKQTKCSWNAKKDVRTQTCCKLSIKCVAKKCTVVKKKCRATKSETLKRTEKCRWRKHKGGKQKQCCSVTKKCVKNLIIGLKKCSRFHKSCKWVGHLLSNKVVHGCTWKPFGKNGKRRKCCKKTLSCVDGNCQHKHTVCKWKGPVFTRKYYKKCKWVHYLKGCGTGAKRFKCCTFMKYCVGPKCKTSKGKCKWESKEFVPKPKQQ
eukprot:gene9424-1631_t